MALKIFKPNRLYNKANMRKTNFPFVPINFNRFYSNAQVKVQNLLCEGMVNPIGLDVWQPRFSWQLVSDKRNTMQTAYEIVVKSASGKEKKPVWNSGKISSQQSVFVPYQGVSYSLIIKYEWQVRIWDNHGNASSWSEVASWQKWF